jgi:hypothetical protein
VQAFHGLVTEAMTLPKRRVLQLLVNEIGREPLNMVFATNYLLQHTQRTCKILIPNKTVSPVLQST